METTITINTQEAARLEKLCSEPNAELARGEIVFDQEVVFPDGNMMVIQVIASEEPDSESCWTQGVLYERVANDCFQEIGCTEVSENFLGKYQVANYIVNVA